MTKRAMVLRWFLPALAAYALGFAAAGAWDLAINEAVYRPGGLLPILMECFGWYPAFVPTLLWALLLLTEKGLPGTQRWRQILGGALAAAGFAALYYASCGYMVKRGLLAGPRDPLAFMWLLAGVLLAGALVFGVWRLSLPVREKLGFLALWGSVYMVANQVVVYVLKYIWGRVRFDDMLASGSFDAFTPWWRPFGSGGSSFPSGHTANACGIFVLLILCDLFPTWARRRKWVTALCWVYVAAMAWARMRIGRHFLSDTLAASALMALIFWQIHRSRRYQKGLRAVRGSAAALPADDPLIDDAPNEENHDI